MPKPLALVEFYLLVGRGGPVGRAQVSKSRGSGFDPTDAVSNLGQVRLPHVALVSKGRF